MCVFLTDSQADAQRRGTASRVQSLRPSTPPARKARRCASLTSRKEKREASMDRLKGKVAMVVGAGSIGPGWGNGKATAATFAREGAPGVCGDRTIAAGE